MKKFLVIYGMPAAAMEEMKKNMDTDDQKKDMDEWMQWMSANKESFADMGNPAGKNTRVTSDGASQESNEIGGYSIMQGESMDDVVKVVQSSPHFHMPGVYVEVMELVDMG